MAAEGESWALTIGRLARNVFLVTGINLAICALICRAVGWNMLRVWPILVIVGGLAILMPTVMGSPHDPHTYPDMFLEEHKAPPPSAAPRSWSSPVCFPSAWRWPS